MDARSSRPRRIRRLGRVAVVLAVAGAAAPGAYAVSPDEGYRNAPAGEITVLTEPDPARPQVAIRVPSTERTKPLFAFQPRADVVPADGGGPATGLDWRDGVIGSAGGLGMLLLALGSIALVRRARTRGRLATA
jgi:hypothetical protein